MSLSVSPPSKELTPRLPEFLRASPEIVLVYDRIRFALSDQDDFGEFCWFAREYPRCYRFHVDGAEFRLRSVHSLMQRTCARLVEDAGGKNAGCYSLGISDRSVEQIYWDFESFLSEISVALDLMARVVGPAFRQQTPPSFNRICKWPERHPILDELRTAQTKWVNRLKDYRDCFVHYTPVDTMLTVSLDQYRTGWEFRAKLPANPNVREILGFKYSRRTELLRYAISTYRHFRSLDRRVARHVWRLYRAGEFPQRRQHLFFVGARTASSSDEEHFG